MVQHAQAHRDQAKWWNETESLFASWDLPQVWMPGNFKLYNNRLIIHLRFKTELDNTQHHLSNTDSLAELLWSYNLWHILLPYTLPFPTRYNWMLSPIYPPQGALSESCSRQRPALLWVSPWRDHILYFLTLASIVHTFSAFPPWDWWAWQYSGPSPATLAARNQWLYQALGL